MVYKPCVVVLRIQAKLWCFEALDRIRVNSHLKGLFWLTQMVALKLHVFSKSCLLMLVFDSSYHKFMHTMCACVHNCFFEKMVKIGRISPMQTTQYFICISKAIHRSNIPGAFLHCDCLRHEHSTTTAVCAMMRST